MNRREMMKVAAAALVGGPAALAATQAPAGIGCWTYLPCDSAGRILYGACRTGKTLPGAVEFARAMMGEPR